MAPPRKPGSSKPSGAAKSSSSIPTQFRPTSDSLKAFTQTLSTDHAYIAHVDLKPAKLKRNVFMVPVGMNVVTLLLLAWRIWIMAPYYAKLVGSAAGIPNDTSFDIAGSTWGTLSWEIGRRGLHILLDYLLLTLVWPEPRGFFFGASHGNPIRWRWAVGFRDQEVYVRRSTKWDAQLLPKMFGDDEALKMFLAVAGEATASMLLSQKTGYLTMSPAWTLDWQAMVDATALVDKKEIAAEAFKTVVFVHHPDHGWLSLEMQGQVSVTEEDRRRQVFAFRDALAAAGKEDLFFRWIEIVQFESTQPGGFGPERQEETAKKIRELFAANDVDFDTFWKQSVGS